MQPSNQSSLSNTVQGPFVDSHPYHIANPISTPAATALTQPIESMDALHLDQFSMGCGCGMRVQKENGWSSAMGIVLAMRRRAKYFLAQKQIQLNRVGVFGNYLARLLMARTVTRAIA
jgi:hypothetical protein